MKVVLLAGGTGTRISDVDGLRPKPMIEVGGMPILWHIMKEYSYYGFNEFIICAGYKQHMIKEWFANYFMRIYDVTFDFSEGNKITILNQKPESWKVTVVDTGKNTMTGGRIKRIKDYVGNESFMMTYGDGVCDVDIAKLVEFHNEHGKIATLTSVLQKEDKGVIAIGENNTVKAFREKQQASSALINAGYMVLEPEIFDYLEDDTTIFEQGPLQELVKRGELISYQHEGFWQCMDTGREMILLNSLWDKKEAPWKVWE